MSGDSIKLIASCAFGLEAIVKRELLAHGIESQVVSPGKLCFEGDYLTLVKTNLALRTADRIAIEMGRFQAADFDALFETTRNLPWAKWLPVDAQFPVTGKSRFSKLSSVPACQRAVKKAIVESLQRDHGVTALPESGALYRVEIALLKDEAVLTIDTTGPSLHKRGYRDVNALAPLKETMAAALVMLSFWRAGRPFLDPFCGSGTIAIEAAMIGRDIAPGLLRTFSAEAWPQITSQQWQQQRSELRSRIKPNLEEKLWGADHDWHVLKLARSNAQVAGVQDDVHFQQRSFEETTSSRKYGCMITNPPYGERLSDQAEVLELYRRMPSVLQRLETWSHFILTSVTDFESIVHKQADRRRKLFNGRIECTFFQYHGPKAKRNTVSPTQQADEQTFDSSDDSLALNPQAGESAVGDFRPSPQVGVSQSSKVEPKSLDGKQSSSPSDQLAPPPANEGKRINTGSKSDKVPTRTSTKSSNSKAIGQPVFGAQTEKAVEQAELFRRRLAKRVHHLRRYPTRQGIFCYRIYERDIPEIPLVVDRYEGFAHVTEYERPHDRDLAQHVDWLDAMANVVSETLSVPREQVYLKSRDRQRGLTQHERLASDETEVRVRESDLSFVVNLSDYIDTGLFLDHRITRRMVREQADGRAMLNLFGYTGSFSVYAAAGGAASTLTVDLSQTYLRWARRNLELNGFERDRHHCVQADSVSFVRQLPANQTFGLAVVDPPTFSNSKRTDTVWDVQHHYLDLLTQLIPHMEPGGVIFFSTNSRRFKFDHEAFAEHEVRELSKQTVPPEYRNRRIHRCWRITCGSRSN